MKKVVAPLLTLLTYVMAVVYFYPVLWMLMTGFKSEGDAVKMPPSLLFSPTMENYRLIWDSGVAAFFGNSVIVTLTSTLFALLLGVPAAYGLAMFKLKRSEDVLFWFMSTKFLPVAGIIIPLFMLLKEIRLLDNLWALFFLYTAMNVPLVVWMMRSFFKEVPLEVMESARVDGASDTRTFFQITLPLVRPGLISTALLSFIFAWNEFFLAVSLTATNAATMPVHMASFMTQQGLFWAKMSSVASIAVVPALLLGWFTQKQLVRGMTMGAVKG